MEEKFLFKILHIKKNEEGQLINNLFISIKILSKKKLPENLVKISILKFLIKYNPLHSLWKNKAINNLSRELIKNYYEKNPIELSLKSINHNFNENSSFKELVSFKKEIPKEKLYLECYFKLILLLKDIKILIKELQNILKVKNESIITQLQKMNFFNPYACVLIRELITDLITNEKNEDASEILKEKIINIKQYYLFHCPTCMEILNVYVDPNNNFLSQCINNHYFESDKNNFEYIKTLASFSIKCDICGINIELYENNFKCLECQNFFCQNCKNIHKEKCLKFCFVNIYNVGFICKKHNEKFISFCFLCQENLCKICKYHHPHMVSETNYYKTNEIIEENKVKDLPKDTTLNSNILQKLIFVLDFMKNFGMYNFKMFKNIYFSKYKQKTGFDLCLKDFYSDQFFDDNFLDYYSKLIEDIKLGKVSSRIILDNIYDKYEEYNKTLYFLKYLHFMIKCLSNESKRNSEINNYIDINVRALNKINRINISIDSLSSAVNLEKKINKLKNEIQLFKIKTFSLFKNPDIYNKYVKGLINSYLSDLIIRNIIKKYHDNMNTINLNISNVYEIINNCKNIKNKIKINFINLINEIKTNDKFKTDVSNYFNKYKNDNQITFKNSLNIGNNSISKNELNFIIELLFYLKNNGNIISHQNVDPNKIMKIIEENKNKFGEIINNVENTETNENSNLNNLFNNNIKNCNSIFEDDLMNSEEFIKKIKEEIKNEMKNIKREISKDFEEALNKNQVFFKDIFNFIFKNQGDKFFNKNNAILRILEINIIKSINNNDFDLNFKDIQKYKKKLEEVKKLINSIDKDKEQNFAKLGINSKKLINYQVLVEKIFKEKKLNYSLKKNILENNYDECIKDIYVYLSDLQLDKDLDENEGEALILYLSIPFIKEIEVNNFEVNQDIFNKTVKNYILYKNIRNKFEKIYNFILGYFSSKVKNDDTNIINDVKTLMISKNAENPEILDEIKYLDMTIDKVQNICEKLLGNDKIDWLNDDKDISLICYLYLVQNNAL